MRPWWGAPVALAALGALSGCNLTEDMPAPYELFPDPVIAELCFGVDDAGLRWPLACNPRQECWRSINYPDLDADGIASDCSERSVTTVHAGTDLGITEAAMYEGVDVFAAAAGEVLFVHDGKHDRCDIDEDHPDCQEPADWREPGQTNGHRVCTEWGPEYCNTDSAETDCFRCFDAGNLVVLRHSTEGPLFITLYAHLRKDSALVTKGDVVAAGDPIALVGSSGQSTAPHLHFEIWRDGTWFRRADPWAGPCSTPEQDEYLFANDPPWCG